MTDFYKFNSSISRFDQDQKRAFQVAISSLVKFCKEKEIDAIFFVDGAARPAALPFSQEWNRQFPDSSKMPKRFFINPSPFITSEALAETGEEKVPGVDYCSDAESMEKLEQFFLRTRVSKNSKILIHDTCSHSGFTLMSLERIMRKIGVANLEFAIANDDDYNADNIFFGKVGDIGVTQAPLYTCHPYGNEYEGAFSKPDGEMLVNLSKDARRVDAHRNRIRYLSSIVGDD